MIEPLTMTTPSDREIAWTRKLDAPRDLVFETLTKPELLRRWLLGPDGWTMPVCEVDLRVGGKFRYVWQHKERGEMGMQGVYKEIVRPEKLVHTEVFDDPWYPGEARAQK
ncbi:MAG: SRPBCC domain-containing protein [Spirochaetia bacterium]|nr:SRPBCC domain-containing protein [Spirochaetia bacterium]